MTIRRSLDPVAQMPNSSAREPAGSLQTLGWVPRLAFVFWPVDSARP